jgi:hypothetical protein
MDVHNALNLQDLGARTLSGDSIRDGPIQQAFCALGETLLAWIVAGTPTGPAHAMRPDDSAPALTDWTWPGRCRSQANSHSNSNSGTGLVATAVSRLKGRKPNSRLFPANSAMPPAPPRIALPGRFNATARAR